MTDLRTKQTITIAGGEAAPLKDDDRVELSCGKDGCPANCCTNGPPVVLNPYEIARICAGAGLSYEDLLDIVDTDRAGGLPLVLLLRDPSCSFWTGQGCRVYADRPLACRLFPLGRVFENSRSHIVLPQRNACSGLVPAPSRTVAHYLAEQDTMTHIAMADAWIACVEEMERWTLPDKPVTSVAFHMLVYSPDAPPSDDPSLSPGSPEERFLLRLATARRMLPRYLGLR